MVLQELQTGPWKYLIVETFKNALMTVPCLWTPFKRPLKRKEPFEASNEPVNLALCPSLPSAQCGSADLWTPAIDTTTMPKMFEVQNTLELCVTPTPVPVRRLQNAGCRLPNEYWAQLGVTKCWIRHTLSGFTRIVDSIWRENRSKGRRNEWDKADHVSVVSENKTRY